MSENTLPGVPPPPPPRARGRPRGATNKRSEDLVRYIEAFYGGLTPGQQAAAIGMVTPQELRAVQREARKAKVSPVVVAMAAKARVLAGFLSCTAAEAWELMRKERAEVMPYVHQKRAQKIELDAPGAGLAVLLLDPGPADTRPPAIEGEFAHVEENQGLNAMVPLQVASPKSHAPE